MIETITIETKAREALVDITADIQRALARAGARDGAALIFSTHTTAGLTINENADPDVAHDILHWLAARVPQGLAGWRHGEGNSDAHLKTSLLGVAQVVPVEGGRLALGRWQGIFLAEFDGPRVRKVLVRFLEAK
jgi:secondary thiamine-phosphate synthase enzyme